MKKIIAIICLLSISSFQAFADEIDDLFAGGEDQEFEFERFSEENVMEAIAHDAGIVCRRGLCTLTSNDTRYNEFSININGGFGNNASGGFGGFGNGTYINLGQGKQGDLTLVDRTHGNVNLQLKIGSCRRKINIPRSLYYSINRYMYGLMNEDSTTRRSFTPADEAMILFYTTIMKEASACK